MKKFYLNLLAVLALVVTCVGFASCSSDDDDDKNKDGENAIAGSIVGTWRSSISDGEGYMTYVFNSDNTGYSQEFDEGRLHNPDFFTWMYNSNTKVVSMIFPDEDNYVETWTIKSISSKSITIIDEDGYEETYTRQ